jgi:hypothetical protein
MKKHKMFKRSILSRSTRFGTYGFMSMMLAAQLAALPAKAADQAANSADRATVDVKKGARDIKRDAKKAGRDVTGNHSTWQDTKDSVGDAAKDVKDEAGYTKRKVERKAR